MFSPRLSIYLSVILLFLHFCSLGFGQTADCDNAAEACKRRCSNLKIYDDDREGYVKESDFEAKCVSSCTAGQESCVTQDSKIGCETFYYHCVDLCPWTVVDTFGNISVRNSNSFDQCQDACSRG